MGAIYVIYSESLYDMDINWIADLFLVLKILGTILAFFFTPVFIWVYFAPKIFPGNQHKHLDYVPK